MDSENDNTEEDENMPAQFYRAYRNSRPPENTNDTGTSHLSLSKQSQVSDDDMPSAVYRHYQRTRSQQSADVDEIVQLIMQEGIATQHVKPSTGSQEQAFTTPESYKPDSFQPDPNQPVSLPSGRFGWLKSLSGRSAANSGTKRKGFVAAAAAVLFSVALVPLFAPDKSNTQVLVPAELVQNADQFTPFIESSVARTIGFSSGENSSKEAFQYGVLATDLTLYAEAGEKVAASDLVNDYLSVAADLNSEVSNALTRYVGDADGKIADVLSTFQKQAGQSKKTQWLKMGQSVESVALASRYAVGTSDTLPLHRVLSLAKSVDLPQDDSPVAGLFSKLTALLAVNTDKVESGQNNADAIGTKELRDILSSAEQIKMLMR